jgi:hypothetical protein
MVSLHNIIILTHVPPFIHHVLLLCREEREDMQRAAGVANMGDITQLLNSAPRDVVELLRIAAVIRNVTASLGTSLADRLRICGTYAMRALPPCGSVPQDGRSMTEADETFARWGYRMQIRARLLVIHGYLCANAVLSRALLASLYVFGQDVFLI